jgi:hypothetical protein
VTNGELQNNQNNENDASGANTEHDEKNKQDTNTIPEQVPKNDEETENPDESLLDGSSILGENTREGNPR